MGLKIPPWQAQGLKGKLGTPVEGVAMMMREEATIAWEIMSNDDRNLRIAVSCDWSTQS